MPETPEWRKALRDLAAIVTGVYLLVHESLLDEPNQTTMYVGVALLVGPAVLRGFGK